MMDNDSKPPKSQHRGDDADFDPSPPPFDVFQLWSHSHLPGGSQPQTQTQTLQSYSSSLLSHHVNLPEQAGPGPGIYGASLAVGEQWHFGPTHGRADVHRRSDTNYPGTQPWADRGPALRAIPPTGSPTVPPSSSNMAWPSTYITAEQAPQRNQRPPQELDGFIFDHAGPELASSSNSSLSFPAQFHHSATSNLSTEGPLTSTSGELLAFYGFQPPNAAGFGWSEDDDSALDAVTAADLLAAQYSPSPTPAPRTQRSVSASSSDSPSNSPACAAPANLDQRHEAPSPSLEVIQWQFNTSGSTSRKRSALDDATSPGAVSRTLKKVDFQNKNGKFVGSMMTLGNPKHRRARFTDQQKAETRLARTKGGVCTRCQELKRKVCQGGWEHDDDRRLKRPRLV